VSVEDTIFALASGATPAAIAVVRVSGRRAAAAYAALCGTAPAAPRRAQRVVLRDPANSEHLDEGLALWFPAPASYTGEAVVEFQIHGGSAVTAGVTAALAAVDGVRPAEPGEFTRRAFENGKVDLTAAEGVADLVAAETAMQRRQALGQMAGGLARIYDGWRVRLLRTLAHFEVEIDFPEEDLLNAMGETRRDEIAALAAEIHGHLADHRRGERLRAGLFVGIVGAPNVGKSSLLNLLARRDAAIVSATAGTTRDVVEVHLDLAGYPVVLADTAGLRAAGDAVEREGVRRAREWAARADVTLAVFDAGAWDPYDSATLGLVDDATLCVLNKMDLASLSAPPPNPPGHRACRISVARNMGIDELLERLTTLLARRWGVKEAPALTRVRHRAALITCLEALERALAAPLLELATEDLRLAVRALGRITGCVDVEDVLDVIFRDFCIGK